MFFIFNMSTYREIVYMCLDELKLANDDAYFTQDHIIFLADKYRALLLKKNYTDVKKAVPESDYQTICLDLETVKGIEGDDCSNTYLRSVESIPNLLPVGTPKVSSLDFLAGEITYVNRERMKYIGHNKYLKNIIYCTIGPDNKLYLKSSNAQAYHLEKVAYSGVFENSAIASEMACNAKETETSCDPLDNKFPLEEALIPLVIEFIVKELTNAVYKPFDDINNASDDLSDLISLARRNLKSGLQKQIEGTSDGRG